ncbi:hypothetical protein TRIUR3_26405 [Triticum urartu]|uniref:Uncharacterized protein n=1 Tax=Triticum urartu TaxID=4572 RepID=M8A5E1_TRIUA|nr:hypothetical protein TRIUR3_26405 [Triticum urartu]
MGVGCLVLLLRPPLLPFVHPSSPPRIGPIFAVLPDVQCSAPESREQCAVLPGVVYPRQRAVSMCIFAVQWMDVSVSYVYCRARGDVCMFVKWVCPRSSVLLASTVQYDWACHAVRQCSYTLR